MDFIQLVPVSMKIANVPSCTFPVHACKQKGNSDFFYEEKKNKKTKLAELISNWAVVAAYSKTVTN